MEGWKGGREGNVERAASPFGKGDSEEGKEGKNGRMEGNMQMRKWGFTQYALRITHYVSRFTFHALRF